ncbi:MAG: fluoride efflux transporter CrcB [Marinovum sp.]|nr:fluoride efflux transporter CrcB [Marinovum sp.]
MIVLHVALGGALGAMARYLCTLTFAFPFATVFVNVLGSLVMGVALVWLAEHGGDKGFDRWQPFVMTGVLGGFTTFSAFSLDTLRLIEGGELVAAVGYAIGTVVLCVAAVFAGVIAARGVLL